MYKRVELWNIWLLDVTKIGHLISGQDGWPFDIRPQLCLNIECFQILGVRISDVHCIQKTRLIDVAIGNIKWSPGQKYHCPLIWKRKKIFYVKQSSLVVPFENQSSPITGLWYVFRCSVLSEKGHLINGLVRYSGVHCIYFQAYV